jgi:preprotein translocase subunit YajC
MNSLFENFNLLQTEAVGGSGSMLYTLVMFGLVFLIFYFLIIRPQNKRQKETKAMLEQLKKGDKVQSIGGIRGVIKDVKEDTVVVTVDSNTTLEFVRSAIANVIKPEEKAQEKKETKKESEAK